MRIHRVYTGQDLEPGLEVTLRDRTAHYLTRVLRVVAGQALCLFNGDGHDYAAEVLQPGKTELKLAVNARLPAVRESGLGITVVQAISRGERMDQTLQKCTELGVRAFQPVVSERVEVRLRPEKLAKRMQHWLGVVIAACEQSGRATIPELLPPLEFSDWLQRPARGQRLVLAPSAGQSLAGVSIAGDCELVVGPEGGFSDTEMGRVRDLGLEPVSLGPRVLRTETAAPAAVAVLQALAGDLA